MKIYLSLFILIVILLDTIAQDDYHLSMQNGHTLPISCVAHHPSEPILATGSQDQSIVLWNATTQKQLQSINIASSTILDLSFSVDGKQLLILSAQGEVILYDLENAEISHQRNFSSEMGYISSVAFSGKPSDILVGSNRNELFIWDTATDEIVNTTKGFKTGVCSNTLSYQGELYVNFKGAKDFQVINSKTLDTVFIPFDKPQNYAFNPVNNIIAVGSTKLIATIADATTGKVIQQIEPNPDNKCDGCNLSVIWSPDGKQLATFDHKNGLYVWDGKFDKPSFSIPLTERINHLSYSKSGKYILMSNDKSLWVVDCDSKKIKLNYTSPYLNDFEPVFDLEEKNIFIPGDYFTIQKLQLNGKVTSSFKGANNKEDNQLPFDYLDWYETGSLKHFRQFMPMVISHDKTFLLFGKVGLEAQKLDLKSGNISSLFSAQKTVTAIAISKDDQLIAAGDAAGYVFIYDLNSHKLLNKIRTHSDMIFDLAFTDDENAIISAGWEGKSYITNLATLEKKLIHEASYATNCIVTDQQDLYYFKSSLDNSITMYERDSHLEVRKFIGHTDKINSLYYDQQKQLLYSCSYDGSVRVWNVASGLLVSKFYTEQKKGALSIAKHPTKEILYIGSADRKLYSIDLTARTQTFKANMHSSGIANICIIDENTAALRGLDGVVKVVDLTDRKDLFSVYLYPQNEWLVVEQKSMQFDGTQKAMSQIHLVKGKQSKEIGNLFNQYYSPGLFIRLLSRTEKPIEQGRNIDELMDNQIDFQLALKNKLNEYFHPIEDSVYIVQNAKANVQIEFGEKYKYQDIFIYNNGKLVLTESSDEEIAFRGSKQQVVIEVPLVPQQNTLSFKVIDNEGIEHTHYPLHLTYDTVAAKTDLYIISLGINQYQNKSYNLKYAKNDATEFIASLEQIADELYENVFTYSLADKKVTKENVLQLTQEIAQSIGPEDVLVFYYAGHGVMYENHGGKDDFFLVMSDITNLYGGREMLEEKGISAQDLLDISKQMSAQKQVFFLDACQSGAALNVLGTRGVSREKTLAQLARSSGTFFITASQDIEYANESSSIEHGLFTYAILEILTGKAPNYADDIVSMGELKQYVETRVPELSEQFKTNPQYPTGYSFGNDFPIGVLNTK